MPDISIFNKNVCCTEKYIRVHYCDFYNYIMSKYPDDIIFQEKLYWFFNGLTTHPLCKCGQRLKFLSFGRGYSMFCSKKCSRNDEVIKQKIRETSIERYGGVGTASQILNDKKINTTKNKYGVEIAMRSKCVKEKKNNTCLKKYGVAHILQLRDMCEKVHKNIRKTNNEKYGVDYAFQLKKIQEKSSDTVRNRYGVENIMHLDCIKDKMKDTIQNRYGVENIMHLDCMKDKIRNSIKNRIIDSNDDILDVFYDVNYKLSKYKCSCPHIKCNLCDEKSFLIHPSNYWMRKHYNIELCTHLNPVTDKKLKGTWIENYICSILDELNITYIRNTRTVIYPKELDVYIPEFNLAIECNGDYWHSLKDKKYHIDKLNACHSNGIELMTIWEDQLIHNRSYIENLIKSKFESHKYELNYSQIPNKEAVKFVNKYGYTKKHKSAYYLGAYYNSSLLAIIGYNVNSNTTIINQIYTKFGCFIQGTILRDLKSVFSNRTYLLMDNDEGCTNMLKTMGYDMVVKYQIVKTNYILPNSYLRLYHKPNIPHYPIYNSGISKFIIK